MQNIEKLSDNQLIELFKSNYIDKELKSKIINEIDRRDLEIKASSFQSINSKTKAEIIFTSLFQFKKHLQKSSQLLSDGNKKGYKQYWRLFIYGIIFYTVLLLVLTKYFIKPYFIN